MNVIMFAAANAESEPIVQSSKRQVLPETAEEPENKKGNFIINKTITLNKEP